MADESDHLLRRLARRFAGGAPADADVRDLQRAVRAIADAQREQSAEVNARLASIVELVSNRSTSKDATEILQAIRALVRSSDRALAATRPPGEDNEADRADARLYRALDGLAKGDAPIIVGPWTGEVGFELLYWIPFVEWFRTRWKVDAERLVIVSRGGVESWYGIAGARYVDIFSMASPAEFRARTDIDAHKQRELTPFERDIVAGVTDRLRLPQPETLHPRLMYRAFSPFWRDEAGFGALARFTTHRRLQPPDDDTLRRLPADFVAARFYFSDCFPDTAANRAAAQRVVDTVSRRIPVVLLNPGLSVDDHADYAPDPDGRIVAMPSPPAPERNLAVQSAIIARARGFVGTYGGYSYLAPLYGVPALAFYSTRAFKLHHLHVAQRVFDQLDTANVVAVHTGDAWLMHAATENLAADVENAPPAPTYP